MTVNVSSRQLMHPAFVEQVAAAIRDAGIAPDRLRLEITETTLMHSPRSPRDRARVSFGRWASRSISTTSAPGTRR